MHRGPRLQRLHPELPALGKHVRPARTCPRCEDGVSLFPKGRPHSQRPSPAHLQLPRGDQPAAQRVPRSMTPLTNVITIVARAPRKGRA